MSAILVRVNTNHVSIDTRDFYEALNSMSQYGRDGSNIWIKDSVGLGQHLLYITPESHYEKLPYETETEVIVFDGRLDNRTELANRFGLSDKESKVTPDSQLALNAYLLWGESCTSYLLGDFAFAIWSKPKQSLFCARDHIGVRPIYYYHEGSTFIAATDIRAFHAFSDITCKIDEMQIASFLFWPYETPKKTFFQNIHIVPPGQQQALQSGLLRQSSHWNPRNAPDIRYKTPTEYSEHLYELLRTATSSRVRTSYPVGAHISGGLDSSGVAVLANRILREQGRQLEMAYTWSPDEETYSLEPGDERKNIQAICKQEQIACHYGAATGRDFRHFLARDMAVESTPELYEELSVIAHAGSKGIRVLVSGWGGDEGVTYGGGGYLAYLLRHGRLVRLAQITRGETGIRHFRRMMRFLFRHAIIPLLPNIVYNRVDPFHQVYNRFRYISSSFAAHFPDPRELRTLNFRETSNPRDLQITLMKTGHLADRMSTWAVWSSEYHLQHTYPLTDRRILEFAVGLPPDMLYQEKMWRFLYRDALRDMLPRSLGKNDVANEHKRRDHRITCWQILADEVQSGQWSMDIPWLDMDAFRKNVIAVPQNLTMGDITHFAALRSCVRVAYLWQRYMSKK